jgi:methylenetetrahydrofolate dehydrogenase (NAD+)
MSGKGVLLKAESIAAPFIDEVKRSLAQCSRPPKLVGILAKSSAPNRFYANFTKKQCDGLGVEFVLKETADADEGGSSGGVEEAIIEANEDDSVDGIMVSSSRPIICPAKLIAFKVYYPIFGAQQVCTDITITSRRNIKTDFCPQDQYLQQVKVLSFDTLVA